MLIAVDKPLELTSFDVVKRMKYVFPGEKIGHSGTLDPKATGLMVLGIGKDTKKLTSLIGLDKEYETVIDFSKMSDTWDMGYWEKFEEYHLEHLQVPEIKNIIEKLSLLVPTHLLPLPAFSAKKKEGKRLYSLARSGQEVAEMKMMHIHHFEVLAYAFPELSLRLKVGSGTYIRSIAYWLGQTLGLGGIVTKLKRISLGKWNLEELKLTEEMSYHMRGQEGMMKRGILEDYSPSKNSIASANASGSLA